MTLLANINFLVAWRRVTQLNVKGKSTSDPARQISHVPVASDT